MLKKLLKPLGFLFCITFLSLSSIIAQDQDDNSLPHLEAKMVVMLDSMYQNPLHHEKGTHNVAFVKLLRSALDQTISFNYPFDSLKGKVHILYPEDKSFRIFNWVVTTSEFGRRYFGAIQMHTADGSLVLYPLTDHSEELLMSDPQQQVNNKKWYGCEYYRILTVNSSKGKIYTLFGYNNNGLFSTSKLLDALTFNEDGPVFGLPIFLAPDNKGNLSVQNRFIVEYKKEGKAALNYSEERKMILMDNLSSEINQPSRRNTFVPTGRTDGLVWRNDAWQFVEEAIPILKLSDGQAPIDGVMQGMR